MRRGQVGLAIAVLAAGLLLAAPAARADSITYEFTSCHITGGCGTAPYGTVTLTQNGTTVDVTVHLNDGSKFVQTGSGDQYAVKFELSSGFTVTVDQTVPGQTLAVTYDSSNTLDGDGTGNFNFGICATTTGGACAQIGGGAGFTNDITFHVASATISDFIANDKGNFFVADILSGQTGKTGPVDVSGTQVAEPGTLLLLGSGVIAVELWRRARGLRRR